MVVQRGAFKYALLLTWSVLLAASGYPQMDSTLLSKYQPSCVRLVNGLGERGTGFIVYGDEDRLVIATAKHVVVGKGQQLLDGTTPGRAEFYPGGRSYTYGVLYIDPAKDLAFVTVSGSGRRAPSYALHNGDLMNTPIWLISPNRAEWRSFPPIGAGEYRAYSLDSTQAMVAIAGVDAGDSGGMFFTPLGIAGMVTDHGEELTAINGRYILEKLHQINP